jgi:hypothetical protein
MKTYIKTPLACAALAASMISVAQAQVGTFSDDFTGATLDAMWNENGVGGAFDAANDVYGMTPVNATGTAKLQQFGIGGTLSDYTHTVELNLVDFFDPNTLSDYKLKSFGSDGFAEVVFNSFGDIRMYHENSTDAVGGTNLFSTNISASVADGQSISLQQVYFVGTDTMKITYSVDGGLDQLLYSGTGTSGSFGNIITNFVESETNQFSDAATGNPDIEVNSWSLTASAIPEPGTYALLAGCFALASVMIRRRR